MFLSLASKLHRTTTNCRPAATSASIRSLHCLVKAAPREEQTLPGYHEKRFYPASIGQSIDGFRVVAKLGYGSHSTVWLAKDGLEQYVALKICTKTVDTASPVTNELCALRRSSYYRNEHPGVSLTRTMKYSLAFDGHECIVMSPQACTLEQFSQLYGSDGIPQPLLMVAVWNLLMSVDWLHLDCSLVHTNISPENILLTAPNDSIYRRPEREEIDNPSTPTFDTTHPWPHPILEQPIYESKVRPLGTSEAWSGRSVLTDFKNARFLPVGATTRGWCMSDAYRAPEVLMGVSFDHLIDVWSIAVMLLELVECRSLFTPLDKVNKQYDIVVAMAQYIGYLGLPPADMIRRSENATIRDLFDEHGQWKGEIPIPSTSLEDFVTLIPPGKDKTQFLAFIRRMLTWEGSQRATTADMLDDDWLRKVLLEVRLSRAAD